ncbi:hypothetical protein KBY82_03200 [Cyanobium sp. AMD-g]|nr:hypothetical protein [Cyanobium sp. AMD-g]
MEEEEARLIQRQALASEQASAEHPQGLGHRMAALFAEAELEEPITEWRGEAPAPGLFEP